MIKLAVKCVNYAVKKHLDGELEVETKIVEVECPQLEKIIKNKQSCETQSISVVVDEDVSK